MSFQCLQQLPDFITGGHFDVSRQVALRYRVGSFYRLMQGRVTKTD